MTNDEALKYFKDAYQQVARYQANSTPHPQIAVMGQAFAKAIEVLDEVERLQPAAAKWRALIVKATLSGLNETDLFKMITPTHFVKGEVK